MVDRRTFLQLSVTGAGLQFAGPLWAQSAPAVDDAELVGEILRTLHPGLYRYLTPKQADTAIAEFQREFRGTSDLAQKYLALSRLLAAIRCGHSYANFYNQSKAVQNALFDRNSRLPFAFRWIGEQMVVTQDHSGTGKIQPGTIIKIVNGTPAHQILNRLMSYVRADGHNDDKRRMLLSVNGNDRFETFDIFHGLIFGPPQSGKFDLQIVSLGGRTKRIQLAPFSLQERQSFQRLERPAELPLWDWRMVDDSVAILTMDSWGIYDSKWPWEKWLDERLNSLAGGRGLIVDLRKNEGGLDCGDAILARFAKADLKKPSQKRLLRYQKIPAALNPYLDTWDDSFRNRGDTVSKFDEQYFQQRYDAVRDVIAAKAPRLDMPLVVLTGAENSSATFQFASLVQSAGLGTIIGEPTGGNRRGINGGSFFFVRLPQSGLEFDLPLIGFYPDAPQPDAGLEPDIKVMTNIDDIRHGRDRVMQAALNHISRKVK